MEYYKGPFNYNNTLELPSVTREYLLSIGVNETSIKFDLIHGSASKIFAHRFSPIDTILSQNYDCVVPVWKKDTSNGFLLVRKGKDCKIICLNGERCGNAIESYVTIIPPINSYEFVVQRKDGKWGVVVPHRENVTEKTLGFSLHEEESLVDFGKYKYLWGFDSGLCMFEVGTDEKQTFSNRGIINSTGIEVVKPYTYTDIYDFYGKEYSYIKVEKEDKEIYLDKINLAPTTINDNNTTEIDYRDDIKKCYSSIMEQERVTVNMGFSLGLDENLRSIYQTLDVLKIIMVYAWEKLGYGTYKDYFHGKELESKYLDLKQHTHEDIVNNSKNYLKKFHVRTIFDDDLKTLEKMEEIINSLGYI